MPNKKWECIAEKTFDGDIVITDPTYLKIDGSLEEMQENLRDKGLFSSTFYGDWGCTVYRTKNDVGEIRPGSEEMGVFCADAGMVCVMALNDALKTCPDFIQWLDGHYWCGTVIRGFHGNVRFMTKTEKHTTKSGIDWEDVELHVRGDGTIDGEEVSFESIQTSC